eukprot:1879337-Pyramimonas_sp.AAC.2
MIPTIVRRAGYWLAVISPGQEPRAGHPARRSFFRAGSYNARSTRSDVSPRALCLPRPLHRSASALMLTPRPPCPRGKRMITTIVRRAGSWRAVLSPGKEPRVALRVKAFPSLFVRRT